MNEVVLGVKEVATSYTFRQGKRAVPAGYKQTEVGVIPEDWEIARLIEVAGISSGTTPPRSKGARYFCEDGVPWIKTLDLNNGDIADTDESVTAEAIKETSLRLLPIGTVLVAMYGGYAQIGRTGRLTVVATTNQALSAISPSPDRLDSKYLLSVLNYRVGYWKSVAGSSRKDPNITGSDVREFRLALPPIKEQQGIAVALSDVDALLRELDRLIAKKRDIKQATMQQLLTGQTRLPGFEGEWRWAELSAIADIRSGGTPSTTSPEFWAGDIPWCTPTDITELRGSKYLLATERTISMAGLRSSSAELIPPNSIIMTTRATIGECAINLSPMTTNQGFKNLIPTAVDHEFLYYLMTMQKSRLLQLCAGSTFLEIGKKQLEKFNLYIPADLGEQATIAAALSDIDAEIRQLEQLHIKTAALKQAMMQELLTGRIRLLSKTDVVLGEEEVA